MSTVNQHCYIYLTSYSRIQEREHNLANCNYEIQHKYIHNVLQSIWMYVFTQQSVIILLLFIKITYVCITKTAVTVQKYKL